jgi:hypothetical protein
VDVAPAVEQSKISKEAAIGVAKKDLCDALGQCGFEPVDAVYLHTLAGAGRSPNFWAITFTGICDKSYPVDPNYDPTPMALAPVPTSSCMTEAIEYVNGETGESLGVSTTNVDPSYEWPTPNAEGLAGWRKGIAAITATAAAKLPLASTPTVTPAAAATAVPGLPSVTPTMNRVICWTRCYRHSET